MKGVPLRTITFIQTRLSFSLIGQPGMTPARLRNVAVSGIGSLAHFAAISVMKRVGNEKVTYISTNTTGNSYTALLGKAADAVILTPPYTSMATLAGYVDLGNTYDVRDLQGGLVARAPYLQERREQVKAVIRATLRSMDSLREERERSDPEREKGDKSNFAISVGDTTMVPVIRVDAVGQNSNECCSCCLSENALKNTDRSQKSGIVRCLD
jgi:hypothetical protein